MEEDFVRPASWLFFAVCAIEQIIYAYIMVIRYLYQNISGNIRGSVFIMRICSLGDVQVCAEIGLC